MKHPVRRMWLFPNKKTVAFISLSLFLSLSGCKDSGTVKNLEEPEEKRVTETVFKFNKGVNISNWLSQSPVRGEERDRALVREEVQNLAGWGFDHLRLPVDEVQLFSKAGEMDAEVKELIHRTINWCREAGMRIILDLHILRSHSFENEENALWTDRAAQEHFFDLWQKIMQEFGKYPEELLAYELLNEPVAPQNSQWSELAYELIGRIRKAEPARVLILGSNSWNAPANIEALKVPENDPNLILSFHFYEPYLFTHYHTSWSDFNGFHLTLTYPGQLIDKEELSTLTAAQQETVRWYNTYYDRDELLSRIQPAVTAARKKGLKLHCGEFGCYCFTDYQSKLNWLTDIVSLFRENDIAYSLWEYKAGFGFCNADGTLHDENVLNILTR